MGTIEEGGGGGGGGDIIRHNYDKLVGVNSNCQSRCTLRIRSSGNLTAQSAASSSVSHGQTPI